MVAIAVNSIRMLELNTSPLDDQCSAFESPHSPHLGLGLLTSKAQAVRLLRLRARRHLESRPGREHLDHMLATYPNKHVLIRRHLAHMDFTLESPSIRLLFFSVLPRNAASFKTKRASASCVWHTLEMKSWVYYCIPRAALQSSHNASDLDGLALLCDLPQLDTHTVYKNTTQESLSSEMLCKHEALLFLYLLFLRFSCLKRKKSTWF